MIPVAFSLQFLTCLPGAYNHGWEEGPWKN